jgi:hypothetical protein
MGQSSWITILLRVRVPVLSEHSMFMPAISSMEARRVTIAPSCDSWREPSASVVVHTISMAMGMDATSSTTVKDSASLTGSLP